MRLIVTTQTVDKNDPILGFFHGWLLEFGKYFEHIDVICLRKGVYDLPSHIHVHSLGKEEGENRLKYVYRFYRYFFQCFFSGRVDYVFYHMGAIYNILAFPFFLVRRLRHTEFLWWKTHGKVGALKETLALACVDRVYTAGSKSFDRKTDKVRVVGHAIDTEVFTSPAQSAHHPTHCLMVGRLVRIKKIEVALRALQRLETEIPDITLDLIGAPDQTEYEASLHAYAEARGLRSVYFRGAQPPYMMPLSYAETGILLHPAYEAGFDKAVLEAMASGVIPVTSIPSFEPILAPFGLFVSAEDDAGYAAAILRIVRMSEAERASLREKLRTIVVLQHSLRTLPARIFGV